MDNDRHDRALETLQQLDPTAHERIEKAFGSISPDFAKLAIDIPFGDILSRPGLDIKTRLLAIVSALTALGTAQPQIKVYINWSLNAGCSPQEISEIIMQTVAFAGLPAAVNGMLTAKEIFRERDLTSE